MEKTALEIKREKEFEKVKGLVSFNVINQMDDGDKTAIVKTPFNSIDGVLHKVKLDMMLLPFMKNLSKKIEIECVIK